MSKTETVEDEISDSLRKALPFHVNLPKQQIAQPNILRKTLTRENMSRLLNEYQEKGKIKDSQSVLVKLCELGENSCIVIFAMLLLVDKGDKIEKVLEENVYDKSLPLVRSDDINPILYIQDQPGQELRKLSCFSGGRSEWSVIVKTTLCEMHWYLTVPHMSVKSPDFKPFEDTFSEEIKLPWTNHGHTRYNGRTGGFGGYSAVSCHHIDDRFHGFQGVLQSVGLSTKEGLFALKILDPYSEEEKDAIQRDFRNDQQRLKKINGNPFRDGTNAIQNLFDNEKQQLKNFNGVVHNHLVTLLAAFEQEFRVEKRPMIKSCFVFPWANCDLFKYWETQKIPNIKWVSQQLDGLVSALDNIHNPPHMEGSFGRHGDLKPDNILWYSPYKGDQNGILVVSDMGFTAVNSEVSRSMQTNGKPRTPSYRPPEMDIDGAVVTREYDIWCLGCIFLEMMTWLVGGHEFNLEFKQKRASLSNGVWTYVFFTFDGDKPAVKPAIIEWMKGLRTHERSTDFVRHVVEVIEEEMIVPLVEGRSKVADLKGRFHDIKNLCVDPKYYTPRV